MSDLTFITLFDKAGEPALFVINVDSSLPGRLCGTWQLRA
jgi:hypothetical protein